MAAFTKFDSFHADLAHGRHDFSHDPLKVMLTNTAPKRSFKTKEDLTDIAPGNGYDAGGALVTVVSSGHTNGLYRLVLTPLTFKGKGGSFGPFQYAVVYNAKSNCLFGWYDYGSPFSVHDSDSFAILFDGENGIYQLA